MREIKQHVAEQQLAFANHPFFRWLETTSSRDDVARAMSQLAFWVASFQDALAINESKIADDELRAIARHQRKADAGNDRWFFEDLHRLGMATLTAQELFAKPTAPVRRAAYGLMSEVFRATDDIARITLLLALESSGHVFLDATSEWVERVAGIYKLKYFARERVPIEQMHFEQKLDILDDLLLDSETRTACIAVVDRTYDAFYLMFDTLLDSVREGKWTTLVQYVALHA